MLFLYASIVFILNKWWRLACIFFSLAVSIKMNVLLFSPALFVILALSHGLVKTFGYIFLCAIIQVKAKPFF
jgi:alpha-1,3-mannosyltransferase